ncbi:hypothetical protein [Sinorhizobium meliloti]|uniref:hypothetical protein n=1 Tax=Rhizobium meliloti TaxID=382 RepID=UPI001F2A9A1E|nr:hypothetical protein [Sinorhizobium meliloti]
MPELGDAWTTDLLSRQFSGVEHELLGLVQAYGLAHRLLIRRSERILLERLLDAPAESVTQSQISGGHFNPAMSLGLP